MDHTQNGHTQGTTPNPRRLQPADRARLLVFVEELVRTMDRIDEQARMIRAELTYIAQLLRGIRHASDDDEEPTCT
jgi:hypothetical protein